MSDYFYSLHMLITGRAKSDYPNLSAMDVIAYCIADEEREVPKAIQFMFKAKP